MDRREVFEKMTDICRDVFDESDLVITDESTAADVLGWDSLTHLSLINELEQEYGIAFTLDEVTGSKNIGDLLDAIMKHIEKRQVG